MTTTPTTVTRPSVPLALAPATLFALAIALLTEPAPAASQFDPEAGDTGAWQAPPVGDGEEEEDDNDDDTPPPAREPARDRRDATEPPPDRVPLARNLDGGDEPDPAPPPLAGEALPEVQDPARLTDHHDVVGRFGVGFFGVLDVVSGPVDVGTGGLTRIDAPSLGVRHWMSDLLGVEAAVGLGFTSTSVDADGDGDSLGSSFGLVLHGGLPVTLYHFKHYAFLVIPEMNLGFGGGSAPSATGDGDDDFFGVLFDLGVRLGAEIHFGFIGIPDLSLQAAVGLRLRVEFARETICADAACDQTADNSVTVTRLATSVEGDPWDIFTGAITAIYYF